MLIIGLTGASGSGKTTIAGLMAYRNIYVLDADITAREIVKPGKPALLEIIEAFGEDIIHDDGTLKRKKLGNIVFNDRKKLEILNDITHKYIVQEVKRELAEMGEDISVIDAAVLAQSGLIDICDYVIAVVADDDLQIQRIMERDELTEQEAKARISSQQTREQFIADADFVIDTSGDVALEVLLDDIMRQMGEGIHSER